MITHATELRDRVALVTGGTSGIGLAAAESLLECGAKVVISGRSQHRAAGALRQLGRFDDSVTFVAADVTVEAEVRALVDAVVDRYGRVDIAFNNAANVEAASGGAFTDMSLEEFEGIVRASLTSVWLCMRHEIPAMLANGGGAIVNTSSVDALLCSAGTGSYAAAKSGVIALSRAAAKEYASQGIRINTICPGAIRTPMLEANLDAETGVQGGADLLSYATRIAARRVGAPAEVAEAVVWLCSDRSSYVVGHNLVIDGAMGL